MARNRYSVPCELAGHKVSTRLYPNRVSIVANDAIVASHERLICRGRISYDWSSTKLTWCSASPVRCATARPLPTCQRRCSDCDRACCATRAETGSWAQVLAAVPTAGLEAVLVAVELVIESGALSAEHVLNVLARLNATPTPQSVETTLQLKEAPLANTSRYDSLRSVVDLVSNAVEVSHAQ